MSIQMQEKPEHVAKWEQLTDGYRDLGGVVDNVVQKRGNLGLGLFPIDPTRPVELSAPAELLVPVDQVTLINGEIKLKHPDQFPTGYADWFAYFQREFSWGADGRQSILTFENQLRSLPSIVQQQLLPFCMTPISERLPSEDDENIFQRFLRTRQIYWEGKAVLMPLIELVNHSASQQTWDIRRDCIRVSGNFSDEVLVRYSVSDPLRRFLQYGFNCKEPTAFSMNIRGKYRDRRLVVKGGLHFSKSDSVKASIQNGALLIDRPLLGSKKAPKAPKRVFREAFSSIKNVNPDELFEYIAHINRIQILNLLKRINQIDQPFILELQRACLNQLEALSWSIT